MLFDLRKFIRAFYNLLLNLCLPPFNPCTKTMRFFAGTALVSLRIDAILYFNRGGVIVCHKYLFKIELVCTIFEKLHATKCIKNFKDPIYTANIFFLIAEEFH